MFQIQNDNVQMNFDANNEIKSDRCRVCINAIVFVN